MDTSEKSKYIESEEDLLWLVSVINDGKRFASNFVFKDVLFEQFFSEMRISQDEFYKNRFYFDRERDIHISWSVDDEGEPFGLWISTYGLVCYKREDINNVYVNSLYSHNVTISLLIREAKELIRMNETYDTTSQYNYLRDLAQALYHNMLFFYELVGKCYLAFCDVEVPKTHKLEKILEMVKYTMFKEKHNDSLFHLYIVHDFQKTVEHIRILPSNFREEFVKYNDNENDNTLIVFSLELLNEIERIIEIGCEWVTSLSYGQQLIMKIIPIE